MKNYSLDGFEIKVEEFDNKIVLNWRGKCRVKDASDPLNSYLKSIFVEINDRCIEIHFNDLSFITSSGIFILVSFLKECNTNQIKTKLFFNSNSDWQKSTFNSLVRVLKKFECVSFEETVN
jgi:hypothetical protein